MAARKTTTKSKTAPVAELEKEVVEPSVPEAEAATDAAPEESKQSLREHLEPMGATFSTDTMAADAEGDFPWPYPEWGSDQTDFLWTSNQRFAELIDWALELPGTTSYQRQRLRQYKHNIAANYQLTITMINAIRVPQNQMAE